MAKKKNIQKKIGKFIDKTKNYNVVIGADGFNSLSDVEEYFDEYYLPEYTKKLTTVIMLLLSWYRAKIIFHVDDKSSKYYKYNDLKLSLSSISIPILMDMISDSLNNISYLEILFKDDENKKFIMYIYGDATVGFANLSKKTRKYIKKQLDKQGLSLFVDKD